MKSYSNLIVWPRRRHEYHLRLTCLRIAARTLPEDTRPLRDHSADEEAPRSKTVADRTQPGAATTFQNSRTRRSEASAVVAEENEDASGGRFPGVAIERRQKMARRWS
jgi:hypothetical protein